MNFIFTIVITLFFSVIIVKAQDDKKNLSSTSLLHTTDSTPKRKISTADITAIKKDTVISIVKKTHDPHKATMRSLILPGLGQAYNREYWKIPIVYGVLSIPVITFIFNNTEFKKINFAYNALYKATYGSTGLGSPTSADSSDLKNYVDDEIKPGILAGRIDLAALQNARNAYRRNRDYSAFWFLIAWGINVADATVFGHLKNFNVSSDLSIKVRPTFDPVTKAAGVGLVFHFRNDPQKIKEIVR